MGLKDPESLEKQPGRGSPIATGLYILLSFGHLILIYVPKQTQWKKRK